VFIVKRLNVTSVFNESTFQFVVDTDQSMKPQVRCLFVRLKHENEILSSQLVEKVKSVEKEKSEFIASHMAERRNEIAQLKEHHRSLDTFTLFDDFMFGFISLAQLVHIFDYFYYVDN